MPTTRCAKCMMIHVLKQSYRGEEAIAVCEPSSSNL